MQKKVGLVSVQREIIAFLAVEYVRLETKQTEWKEPFNFVLSFTNCKIGRKKRISFITTTKIEELYSRTHYHKKRAEFVCLRLLFKKKKENRKERKRKKVDREEEIKVEIFERTTVFACFE